MEAKERKKVELKPEAFVELTKIFFNKEVPDEIWVRPLKRTITHHHSYGGLTQFYKGLTEGKLLGTVCKDRICQAKGAKIRLPPHVFCPDCWEKMEWVEVNTEDARVHTYSIAYEVGAGCLLIRPVPIIALDIPGVWTHPMSYLSEYREGEPYIGQRVRPVFRTENPTRTILDISWVPVD